MCAEEVVLPNPKRAVLFGLLGIFLLNLAVLSWHIFSHTQLNSVDGMYHIRVAWLYRTQGISTSFPWMHFSIARELWADHHFFYHILLIPFTWGDLLFGMKLSSVLFGALALTACTAYLYAHRVQHAWVYGVILLLASDIFLFRISMPRSISISLIFLLWGLWCLEQRRFLQLLFVSFFYIWTYQTAIVLLPMALCAMVLSRLRGQGWDAKLLLYTFGGLVLGLTLNPFVPDTFAFFYFHFSSAFPGQTTRIAVTIPEWSPLPWRELLTRNVPAITLGLLVPLVLARHWRRWPRDIGLILIGTVVLFVATLKAGRMLEYGVPFAVLCGARIWDAVWRDGKAETAWFRKRWAQGVVGLVWIGFVASGSKYHRDFSRYAFDINPHLFRGAAKWLATHTPKGTVVFHSDWASFSYLFFHNTHNVYISGLSPLFFAAWKPKLYRAYRLICMGRTKAPARWIKRLFQSRYVVLFQRRRNLLLARQLAATAGVKVVYRDRMVRIFELPR